MSQEDGIVSNLIERLDHRRVEPEVHYNHYGSKGVVDLVVIQDPEPSEAEIEELAESSPFHNYQTAKQKLEKPVMFIIEVKSEYAVECATGANEIIRQFKKHKEYFFKGSDYVERKYRCSFELVFEPTKTVHDHISNAAAMYSNLNEESQVGLRWMQPESPALSVMFDNDGNLKNWDRVNRIHHELL